MTHKEKIFKLENGDRLKVEVDFHFSAFYYKYDKSNEHMGYRASVELIEKGKRKGKRVNNADWLPQIQETSLELWQEFKPNFLQA